MLLLLCFVQCVCSFMLLLVVVGCCSMWCVLLLFVEHTQTHRRAGQAPRLPHRAGRDRVGVGRPPFARDVLRGQGRREGDSRGLLHAVRRGGRGAEAGAAGLDTESKSADVDEVGGDLRRCLRQGRCAQRRPHAQLLELRQLLHPRRGARVAHRSRKGRDHGGVGAHTQVHTHTHTHTYTYTHHTHTRTHTHTHRCTSCAASCGARWRWAAATA